MARDKRTLLEKKEAALERGLPLCFPNYLGLEVFVPDPADPQGRVCKYRYVARGQYGYVYELVRDQEE